jgi:molybdopterin-guanine dinucleotide biosynthesis protein A
MNAYLLAGGFSRRFGEDKTLYPFKGTPLILSLFRKVSRHFSTWVIAKNLTKYENLNLPLEGFIFRPSNSFGGNFDRLTPFG